MHFRTQDLTIEQKIDICHRAHAKCFNWWADILDCSKSFCRQQIDMTFEEIMEKFDNKALFSIIHRKFAGENHLEIGFRTMGDPDYFLWMQLDPEYISEFTRDLECKTP